LLPESVETGLFSGSAHEAVNARIIVKTTSEMDLSRFSLDSFMGYAPWAGV
jgi:hypothetical protein